MMLIKGVKRVQGLIVEKGNPKQIHSLNDLTQKITFINRQKGSGTRVLLDYELKKQGIDSNDIQGYEHEVMTHMAVAVAVKEGNADVGLGVYSAAKALDLDFIELADEEYDFALHKEDYELPNIQSFLQVLTSDELKQKLDALGGYRYDEIGKVIDL